MLSLPQKRCTHLYLMLYPFHGPSLLMDLFDMNRDDVLLRIQNVLRQILVQPDLTVTPDTTAAQVDGWDSLAHVSIILGVEKAFAIRLKAAEIAQLNDVGSLIDLVQRRAA